jgi:hypothetical protein
VRRLIPALAVTLALAATPAAAADFSSRWDAPKETLPFTTMGIGSLTCQKFAESYRDNPRGFDDGLIDWAQGYMSGSNAAIRHFSAAQPEKKLNAWTVDQQRDALRSYCDRHPLGRAVDGVIELYNNLPDAHPSAGE